MDLPDPSNMSTLLFSTRNQNETPIAVSSALRCVSQGTVEGRGLVAMRDIKAGEWLFVTPPSVECHVQKLQERYCCQNPTSSVESLAETLLVEAMHQALSDQRHVKHVNSFLALRVESKDCSMKTLLGENDSSLDPMVNSISEKDLLQIVRKNAFGPDFCTYPVIARHWDSGKKDFLPSRVLGIYPLAAMINHSCKPNAVRVYAKNVMIAHASQDIPRGTEIVWSYLPPSRCYPVRQAILSQQHGFQCRCERCRVEAPFFAESGEVLAALTQQQQQQGRMDESLLLEMIDNLEHTILPSTKQHLLRSFVRVGYMDEYIRYLNTKLQQQEEPSSSSTRDHKLLHLCTHLHFSLSLCDMASTEHLSILHLCYELIGKLHTQEPSEQTLSKLRFWTEQLKKVCMIRYGSLGHDVAMVRAVMQHTRLVLRTRDGLVRSQYDFV